MISEIKSFAEYEDFIRSVSADVSFSDPHFLYNENNLYDALKKKNRNAYVVLQNNAVTGLFVWMILPEDRYIELMIGFSKSEEACEEMLSLMEEQHPNYQMDFVINPNHSLLRRLLEKREAKFDTEQQKMIFCQDVSIEHGLDIRLFTPEFAEQYKALHSTDCYWTAERVLEAPERFRVFLALKDGEVVGYLDVTHCFDENEPYSLLVKEEYANLGYEQALLYQAVQHNKPKAMMVLVNTDAADEIKIYESVGFRKVEGQNCVYATYQS